MKKKATYDPTTFQKMELTSVEDGIYIGEDGNYYNNIVINGINLLKPLIDYKPKKELQ